MENTMPHENWLPIEQFDKDAEVEMAHLFLTAIYNPDTGREYLSFDAGSWTDWGEFYNGDGTFEPTHYLNPAVYRKEPV
jgi:hypothetical protein